ncbi:MAG TPA: hypothetical protein RWO66_11210, partial [Ruminococcus sp.]
SCGTSISVSPKFPRIFLVWGHPKPRKKDRTAVIKSANAEIEIKETPLWIPKRKSVADHPSKRFLKPQA